MVEPGKFGGAHYLTVAEVAAALRVGKATVYRLLRTGTLPAVRFGRSYRVPAAALEEYLDAHPHTAGPDHPPPG